MEIICQDIFNAATLWYQKQRLNLGTGSDAQMYGMLHQASQHDNILHYTTHYCTNLLHFACNESDRSIISKLRLLEKFFTVFIYWYLTSFFPGLVLITVVWQTLPSNSNWDCARNCWWDVKQCAMGNERKGGKPKNTTFDWWICPCPLYWDHCLGGGLCIISGAFGFGPRTKQIPLEIPFILLASVWVVLLPSIPVKQVQCWLEEEGAQPGVYSYGTLTHLLKVGFWEHFYELMKDRFK